MKKMLKRADGSTSQRGLWDNIRAKAAANKKAGKKGKAPSKDILKQERKISKYQTGNGNQCKSGTCLEVMKSEGRNYSGDGSNFTGSGASFDADTPRYTLNIVNQTAEEKAAGEANANYYKKESDARKTTKDYEALIKSGKGARTTGTDPDMLMLKDKGKMTTKFYKSKTGGKKSNWLMDSKELMFGGPDTGIKPANTAPTMSNKDALAQVFQGKMTANQAHTAIGKTPKPAMTPEQKAEFISKFKTYGRKTGGKKRMGGKKC